MNQRPHPATTERPRIGGLDGLRAIAVTLVLVYHLWPTALPGGFLGVDVFFVISGFLIASLLLHERHSTGRIALGPFWQRRIRRLLPALALALLVCTSLALAVSPQLLTNIAAQVIGAMLFVANWVYIAIGADYFASDAPELYRNTWSLGIEEQFYLLLPLVLLLALRLRGRATRVLFFAALGIASAWWMAALYAQGADATRVYFGTDTHAFGLLLGVALACAVGEGGRRGVGGRGAGAVSGSGGAAGGAAAPRALALWKQIALLLVGALGLGTLGWLAVALPENSPQSFLGGFQLATLAVLVTVWAASRPAAWLGRALDVAPLRWVGERSYGIYLWHWPLLLIVGALARPAGSSAGSWADSWLVPVVTLLATLALASLSHRYLEQPVRRLGIRRSVALLVRPLRLHGRRLAVCISVLALLVVTVPASAVAFAVAPPAVLGGAAAEGADAVSRGQAALEAQRARGGAGVGGTDAGGDPRGDADAGGAAGAGSRSAGDRTADAHDATCAAGDAGDGGASSAADAACASGDSVAVDTTLGFRPLSGRDALRGRPIVYVPPPPPEPISSAEVFAIGDSVMLASTPELLEAMPELWIDAAVSRGLGAGVGIVGGLAAEGSLRPVLVVGLGTNGPILDEDLATLHAIAGDRRIVLVNAFGDRWWVPEVNAQLRAFAEAHRGVVLADWEAAIAGVEGGLAGDAIHPNPAGGHVYAATVQAALDELLEPQELPVPPRR